MPKFIEIEETFCGRTDVRTYARTNAHLRPDLLGRLCRRVDLNIYARYAPLLKNTELLLQFLITNKYGSISSSGTENLRRLSRLCVHKMSDLIKKGTSLGYFHGNNLKQTIFHTL